MSGLKMIHVPYRGTGPAMNDLISGTFDVMCDQTTNTTGHIKDGRIKGYAVTTKAKVASVPDLPTLDSSALPGFEVSAWHALWAPKGLPKDVTDKLVAALKERDAEHAAEFAAREEDGRRRFEEAQRRLARDHEATLLAVLKSAQTRGQMIRARRNSGGRS